MEVVLQASWRSIWRLLGGRFASLLEVDLDVSSRSLGGLLEVSWRAHGGQVEGGWKSSWQFILRYGADDVGASRSVVESLWLAVDLSWS